MAHTPTLSRIACSLSLRLRAAQSRTQSYLLLLLTIFCLLLPAAAFAQVDTKGTEFWLTFGQNNTASFYDVDLQIRIVADEATTGTIYFTNLQSSVPFSIAAGEVFPYVLDDTEKEAVYNTYMGITDFSIHITTSAPVTVYALNQMPATTDATNILPVTAWGTDYYQISYMSAGPGFDHKDAFAVIAAENNTEVFHNGIPAATLNTGEVYFCTAIDADMTGDHITADKPVAFFVLNEAAFIPEGHWAADQLFQQLAPVNTWGTNFFVPVTHMGTDIVRIVASQNGTNITQTGGTLMYPTGGQTTLSNLNAGEWVELEVYEYNNGCYIEADKPVGVCIYLTGQDYLNLGFSDPAQAWLPAIEQTVNSALMAPFVPDGYTELHTHFALIVTPTATQNNTTVSEGGSPAAALSGGQWYDHSSGYSFYAMPLNNSSDAYLFANSAGLIAMGYGVGNYESYYYLACSSMRDLDVAFYVNDIHHQDLPSEVFSISQMDFRAEIQDAMSSQAGHLKWYIDDVEETAAEDLLTWSKTLSNGVYAVKMEVLLADNVTVKIVESTLVIGVAFDMEICAGKGVTFTVTPHNGGSSPSYQWMVNGSPIPSATASTFYYVPSDGDVVVCELTSSEDCLDSNPVLSHSITVMVKGPASITTPTPPAAVCAGSTLTLTTPAITLNGLTQLGGSWTLNGVYFNPATAVSYTQNGAALAYLIDTDCGTFTSGTVAVTVTALVTPTISISGAMATCSGNSETYTASITNGGSPPGYQWRVNGAPVVGETASTFVYEPENGDIITCVLTSSAPCASPNPVASSGITVTVTPTVIPSVSVSATPD